MFGGEKALFQASFLYLWGLSPTVVCRCRREEKKEIKKKRAKLLLETSSRQPMETVFPVELVREEKSYSAVNGTLKRSLADAARLAWPQSGVPQKVTLGVVLDERMGQDVMRKEK